MNKWLLWMGVVIGFWSCSQAQNAETFTPEALNSKVWSYTDSTETTFGDILKPYQGKKICIDFWASWCKDCIGGMPKMQKYMKEYPEVVFLFVSMDKNGQSWVKRVSEFNLPPERNFIVEGQQKGPLAEFLHMDWIPHYMVIAPNGKIELFKAKFADDNSLVEALQ